MIVKHCEFMALTLYIEKLLKIIKYFVIKMITNSHFDTILKCRILIFMNISLHRQTLAKQYKQNAWFHFRIYMLRAKMSLGAGRH